MAITRPGKTVRCASCCATADKKQGATIGGCATDAWLPTAPIAIAAFLKAKHFAQITIHGASGSWAAGHSQI